jgi:phosphatidylserine/phosphatidylglycerophosphate/cardiolipin synthase-like enzyme
VADVATPARADEPGARQAGARPPRRPGRPALATRLRELWTRRPNVLAFLVLGSLVVALGITSWQTGFRSGFWPNFLLNSAGDLIGGMIVLFLIEPIVRQAAALQIRQHPRLDYAWFLRRVGEARSQIRILDTFSNLFTADRDGAIRALRDAAIQGADIRVLLMSPNTNASTLREVQLRQTIPGLWINDKINANLADFQLVEAAILAVGNGMPHGRMDLRVYTVAAPFTLYGWDDRAMFAFLPPHAFSDQSTQLEITAQSQLGREALDQFEALWQDAEPIPQLLMIEVRDEQATLDMLVRFVHVENATYLISTQIDTALQANPGIEVRFGDQSTRFQPEAVPQDDPAQRMLREAFFAKYFRHPDANFHRLSPKSDKEAPPDRPTEHDLLPTRTLLELIGESERLIRILDTSSTLMAEGGSRFARALEQAMARGVKVEVLLLAPTTQAAQDRAAEIQDPAFDTRIEENIRELRRLGHKMSLDGVAPDRLEVRLYDRLPECSVHQVDDRLMVAFLPYQRRTSRVKHLEVTRDASLGQFAGLQFEAKWETARPLEGMRYADLALGPETRRLLLRIWDADGASYLASNRIEGILAAHGGVIPAADDASGPAVRFTVEDRPGEEYTLSEPLFPDAPEGILAAEAFAAVFGVPPDAPIRRLEPVPGRGPDTAAGSGTVPGPRPPRDDAG